MANSHSTEKRLNIESRIVARNKDAVVGRTGHGPLCKLWSGLDFSFKNLLLIENSCLMGTGCPLGVIKKLKN